LRECDFDIRRSSTVPVNVSVTSSGVLLGAEPSLQAAAAIVMAAAATNRVRPIIRMQWRCFSSSRDK
jgi:hypothetical protein